MTAALATGGSCGVYDVVIHTDRAVLSDEERARLDRLAGSETFRVMVDLPHYPGHEAPQPPADGGVIGRRRRLLRGLPRS